MNVKSANKLVTVWLLGLRGQAGGCVPLTAKAWWLLDRFYASMSLEQQRLCKAALAKRSKVCGSLVQAVGELCYGLQQRE